MGRRNFPGPVLAKTGLTARPNFRHNPPTRAERRPQGAGQAVQTSMDAVLNGRSAELPHAHGATLSVVIRAAKIISASGTNQFAAALGEPLGAVGAIDGVVFGGRLRFASSAVWLRPGHLLFVHGGRLTRNGGRGKVPCTPAHSTHNSGLFIFIDARGFPIPHASKQEYRPEVQLFKEKQRSTRKWSAQRAPSGVAA